MVGSDSLLTTAELAIAIAGFSAVIAVFANHGRLSQDDRSRFFWLFTTAFVAALLAYVPIVLSQAGLSGPPLWRVSSSIMVFAWFASMVPWSVLTIRNRRRASSLPLGVGEPYALLIPSVINLGVQIANVWGGIWVPSSAYYLLGTLIWLYAASLVFMAAVLYRSDDSG